MPCCGDEEFSLQVDELEQLIGVEMTVRMSWRDPRIRVVDVSENDTFMASEVNRKGYVSLNPLLARRIWVRREADKKSLTPSFMLLYFRCLTCLSTKLSS